MFKEIYEQLEQKMKKNIELLRQNFIRTRTGKANAGLVRDIKFEYYGVNTPIDQVANITTPELRVIVIQPWDKSIISDIEKAILKSDLGLTPINDGRVIRINIPPLTEERRKELVKLAKKMAEESKVNIRNLRREVNETIKKIEIEKEISSDEIKQAQIEVQKITDKYIQEIEKLLSLKEEEIIKI